ncbi:hypothetical protein [Reyranella sp.]|uniref:hypothetical protein n=1 Tax=Reyranella sp. TaxID=1929291 RepID=UPI000BC4C875|nr:hypothetical protein [Reyranella sp.]OYZ90441.1 MAG: hypothetical protein B7Y08_29800 [Rhodospirillales bacterium 24-66-33]
MTKIIPADADRIRAVEMVVQVMVKIVDAQTRGAMDECRDVIAERLEVLKSAEQLPGAAGGASVDALLTALELLGPKFAERRHN